MKRPTDWAWFRRVGTPTIAALHHRSRREAGKKNSQRRLAPLLNSNHQIENNHTRLAARRTIAWRARGQ
jgi:hypothetical protein